MKLNKIFKKIKDFIYIDEVSAGRYKRYRSVLGGMLSSDYRLFENASVKKQIFFFNFEVLKKTDDSIYRIWYLFGKKIFKFNLINVFKKQCKKINYKNYDNIFLLWVNSGEVCLFLKYVISDLIKRHNSKRPLIVATKKYHCDLIELYCPEIPYIYTKELLYTVQQSYFEIDGVKFHSAFPNQHFINLEENILKYPPYEKNYFNPILELFNCDIKSIFIRKPVVKYEIEKEMLEKIKNLNLNIDNFIFIAPEAQSCEGLGDCFWEDLIKKYQQQGFDIFVNLTKKDKDKKPILKNARFKTCELSFAESFALAKKAKRIVALRSGFCELLTDANVPIDILYSKFKKRIIPRNIDCAHVMSGFSFYSMPHINKNLIREVNSEDSFENIYKKLGV